MMARTIGPQKVIRVENAILPGLKLDPLITVYPANLVMALVETT